MKIIKNRIFNTLDFQQPAEQGGFRKKFNTIDHIQALNQIIEKTNEFDQEVWLMFIDYNEAFDSILHGKLWQALAVQRVVADVIKILVHLYECSEAYVKTDIKGENFPIQRGVKQGDPLSPKPLQLCPGTYLSYFEIGREGAENIRKKFK